jgi:hypothetical protein
MSEETLHTAARRVVRFFRIDETKGGGLISIETIQAVATLDMEVQRENARIKSAALSPTPPADKEG